MGQFKQLKYFNVDRCFGADIVDQCDEELFTGDGVLPHLQYLNIGDEMKNVNVDHLLKMAPNVKDVGYSLFQSIGTSNYLDIIEKLANRLTSIPFIKSDKETVGLVTQKWLEKTTVLESVKLSRHHVSSIDFSKLKPIPSVKEIQLFTLSDDLLKELVRVFPCVESCKNYCAMTRDIKNTFIELIKEGKWPNLRHVSKDTCKELTEVRPHLTCELNDMDLFCGYWPNSYRVVDEQVQFEKEWLLWDPLIINARRKQSDMEQFFTNGL